jgi:hypothetical protein
MTDCPVFDAVLADAPRNIWEASSIFPRYNPESLQQALVRIGHYRTLIAEKALCDAETTYITVPPLQPDFTDWEHINGYPQGATS